MPYPFRFNPLTGKLDLVTDPTEMMAHIALTDMPDPAGANTDHDGRYPPRTLWTAQSIVYAIVAGTLLALGFNTNEILGRAGGNLGTIAIAADRVLGRLAGGNITDLTIAQILAIILTTQDDILVRGAAAPQRLNIAADRIVGRITGGNVAGLTIQQVLDILLTTRGDIFRHGAATTERYALGAADTFLGSDGTDVLWRWTTFLRLNDTPAAYAGMANRSPVVNAGATALEFAMRADMTTAVMTVYVDSAAVGAGDGTSWADAFTTIQAAWDSLPTIIAHAVTIRVRYNATPYREQVEVKGKYVIASVTIEGEYWWLGDCEANVGGAGEITDTAAFADVAIGDKVYVLDRNGANGRAQNAEVCTVDDISNAPNRIGTDGALTPALNWRYVIVRTEISGSDDGTDPGTARNHCFRLTTIDNIAVRGFYMTFPQQAAVRASNSRAILVTRVIFEDCDQAIDFRYSGVTLAYSYLGCTDHYPIYILYQSYLYATQVAMTTPTKYCSLVDYSSTAVMDYFYIFNATRGLSCQGNSFAQIRWSTIQNTVATGVFARMNSAVDTGTFTTNAAVIPEDPAATVERAYIA